MQQPQITTIDASRQNKTFTFSLKVAGIAIKRPQTAPTIFAHCDMCGEHADGTRGELIAQGWGIYYPASSFCPKHEEMI
jgi:hypothetical protein